MAFKLADAFVLITGDDAPLEKSFDGASKKTNSWVSGLAGNITTVMAGAAAAGAAALATAVVAIGGAAFSTSNQFKDARNDMIAQLGLTQSAAENMGQVVQDVYKNNFGDSIDDVNQAIITTSQNFANLGFQSNEAIQSSVEDAFRLRDAFGIDVAESTSAAAVLMENFGLTNKEAMDFIASGMQQGLNRSGDFLDTIGEYSNQFSGMQFSAGEFFSVMETGMAGGVLGTDKIADAVKEFGIIFNEGGDDVRGAFDDMGMSYDQWVKDVQSGDAWVSDAFNKIVWHLQQIEDPIERSQLQTALFGTMAEDLGPAFTDSLSTAQTSLEDMIGATDIMDAQYQDFPTMLEGFKRRALVALTPLGDKLLEIANDAMPFVEEAFVKLETVVIPIISDAIDWVVQFADEVMAFVDSSDIGGLVDKFLAGFEALRKLFSENDFPDALGKLFDAAIQMASDAFANLWPMVSEWMTGLFENVLLWVQETDWVQVGRNIFDGIVTFLRTLGELGEAWFEFQLLLISWYEAMFTWFLEQDWAAMGQAIMDAIVKILAGFWVMVEPVLTDWWGSVTTWFDEKVAAAKQLGSDLINGVKDGIKAKASELAAEAAAVVTNAITAAKNAIFSRSPSKKAADEVGEPIVQGIEQPLLAGKKRIQRALVSLVDMSGIAGSGSQIGTQIGTQSVGGDTINIKTNNAALVVEMIEQRKRQRFASQMGF